MTETTVAVAPPNFFPDVHAIWPNTMLSCTVAFVCLRAHFTYKFPSLFKLKHGECHRACSAVAWCRGRWLCHTLQPPAQSAAAGGYKRLGLSVV